MAGDLNASGGGSNPSSPYPQGPRYDNGTGNLITGGKDFSGGGFFTGYWLTTGAPTTGLDVTGDGKADLYIGDTSPFSNAIFAGGWYTLTTKFSMTSGTSGVHVCPNPCTLNDIILEVDSPFNPANVGSIQSSGGQGDLLTYTYKVTNTGGRATGEREGPRRQRDSGSAHGRFFCRCRQECKWEQLR